MYQLNQYSQSWVPTANGSMFPVQNIPFGIFSDQQSIRACSRIGDYIVDLSKLADKNLFDETGCNVETLKESVLNSFISQGKAVTGKFRLRLAEILDMQNENIFRNAVQDCLIPVEACVLHLPINIGNYTDFYSSREHATNVGIMFRDPANALLPNWLHLPVGYHGRASSIVVSGHKIKRPQGQIIPKDGEPPILAASRQVDFELEMAFVIGKENEMGSAIPLPEARDHIFGMMLFNDWSARDIQKWEYVPLGPFLAKNFASTVSPWIITLEALDAFKVEGPVQSPKPLEYLTPEVSRNFDIQLEVFLNDKLICASNTKYLYWSISQQLAHHTVNGCNMKVGDLCASGTISGPDEKSYGSMLELCWKGTKPISMDDGSTRTFIQDGDKVTMKAFAKNNHYCIGFGECSGVVI